MTSDVWSRLGNLAIRSWIEQFFVALFASFVANYIFGIPYWQVVDVVFALLIAGLVLQAARIGLLGLSYSSQGGFPVLFLTFLLIILTLMNSFAAVAGYSLYASVGSLPLAGESFVYDGFLERVKAPMQPVFGLVQSVLQAFDPSITLSTLMQAIITSIIAPIFGWILSRIFGGIFALRPA
jgi:hypothetical protein